MNKKLKLTEKLKKFSGFYNASNSFDYVKALESEINELKEQMAYENPKGITEELGDVLLNTMMLYEKLCDEHDIKASTMYKNSIEKYKRRAPHIFRNKFIGLKKENEYWFKIKNE